jgi:hypothetical protein
MTNINILPHKSGKGCGKYTSRTNKELNDKFIAFRKCIDQIPDSKESSLEINAETNKSKFDHTYVQEVGVRWASDINEDISILGTDRNSELATEHCSDAKHCNSYRLKLDPKNNKPFYQFKTYNL